MTDQALIISIQSVDSQINGLDAKIDSLIREREGLQRRELRLVREWNQRLALRRAAAAGGR